MNTIRTAIVGYGLAGSVFHAPLVQAESNLSLDIIVTSNPERADAAKKRYSGVRIVNDFNELLTNADDIDLVVVAAATPVHVPLAILTIEHGIATVVDKPLGVLTTEIEYLIQTCS